MSRENVEMVRASFEKFLAGGSDFGVELLDPAVEWDASEIPAPDIGGVYRGPEGVRGSGGNGSPPGRQSSSTIDSWMLASVCWR